MSDTSPAQSWSDLLLALPEFTVTDAVVDAYDELVAHVELQRDV